jgi:hypothetical protein
VYKEIEVQKLTNENEMLKKDIQTTIKIHELEIKVDELHKENNKLKSSL